MTHTLRALLSGLAFAAAFPSCVAASGNSSANITGVTLEGGSYNSGAFSLNGNRWNTTNVGANYLLGVSEAGILNLLNSKIDGSVSVPPSEWDNGLWTYDRQCGSGAPCSGPVGTLEYGTAVRITINFSNNNTDQAVFKVGSPTSAALWQQISGSGTGLDTLILSGTTGTTGVVEVGANSGAAGLTPSAPNDVLQLCINSCNGGGGVTVTAGPVVSSAISYTTCSNSVPPSKTAFVSTDLITYWVALSGVNVGDVMTITYVGPGGVTVGAQGAAIVANSWVCYTAGAAYIPAGNWSAYAAVNGKTVPGSALQFTLSGSGTGGSPGSNSGPSSAPGGGGVTVTAGPVVSSAISYTTCSNSVPPSKTAFVSTDLITYWVALSGVNVGDVMTITYVGPGGVTVGAQGAAIVANSWVCYTAGAAYIPAGNWSAYAAVNGKTVPGSALQFTLSGSGTGGSPGSNSGPSSVPAFFTGEVPLGSGVYYLQFPNGNLFGYYNFPFFPIFFHYDMGFEAFIDGGNGAAYMYDFTSAHWWYTTSSLFPYLYDFTLNAWLYYFPDTKNPGHYTTNPRYFSNLTTGKIFTM